MNKKILISLGIIGVVAAAVIGGTIAYFNDTETSTGNIFVAGTMDLKVDHTRQTYNDVDCKTCSVTLLSDASNYVVETQQNAVLLTYIHPAWTAQIDCNPRDASCNTKWIWATDPVTQYDVENGATYTFRKTFEWMGPIDDAVLNLGVGADNTYEVWLNGNKIAFDYSENNFGTADTYTYTDVQIALWIVQGQNTLDIKVTNLPRPGWTPQSNPAGLLYKFTINGNCGSDYFKTHCQLWGLKNLENEKFYNFNDVKPGDHGVNVISLHAYDNDAYACLIAHNIQDQENTLVDPELALSDTMATGELSSFIKLFVWEDDGDGDYEGETVITGPNAAFNTRIGRISLAESNTEYIGIAWCAGTQGLTGNVITCDGSTMGDIAQTDILTASITAYAEQQRNNPNFSCATVQIP